MKPFILILEGGIGCGKTTIGNIMREQVSSNTLLSLTGMKDKSTIGRDKTFAYHKSVLNMLEDCEEMNMSFTLVRSFLSEQVYTQLKYKEYSFQSQFEVLLKMLDKLDENYNIYIVHLKLNEEDIEKRLERDKFSYNGFSKEKCLEQMKEYDKQIKYICDNTKNIKCFTIINDNLEATFNAIKNITEGFIGE